MTKIYLLSRAEFDQAESDRVRLGERRAKGEIVDGRHGASLVEVLMPGAMWESWWYFDPHGTNGMADRRQRVLERIAAGEELRDYLSKHYWTDWSATRAPYSVLCPNGEEWCIDAKSSNGDGWKVTGTAPAITATPSIVVTGYHGWLRDGVFTDDIENRGLTGVRRLGPYQGRAA